MENTKNCLSKTHKNLKQVERNHSACSTRKRLLDQVFEKERSQSRNSSAPRKPEFKTISKNSTVTLKTSKENLKIQSTQTNPKYSNDKKSRSRSPACIKRDFSEDLTKTRILRDKSLEKKSLPQTRPVKRPASTSKQNPQIETLTKLVSQFSVQKIQDLKNLAVVGNEDIGKVLILLLKEVDHHLQDLKIVFPDILNEYLTSPGIVVQSIKNFNGFLLAGKVPESKVYLEVFSKAHEIYVKVEAVSNTFGHQHLVKYLENVFRFKKLSTKFIRFLQPFEVEILKQERKERIEKEKIEKEKLEKIEKIEKQTIHYRSITRSKLCPSIPNFSSSLKPEALLKPELKTHTKTESCSIPSDHTKLEIPSNNSFETTEKLADSFDIRESFQDSKKFLLDKFFNKMINPGLPGSLQEKLPLTEVKNLNLEDCRREKDCKSASRTSSTPRPESTSEPRSSESSKMTESKGKHEELKRKNFMVGTRFYKKIDEKFVKMLVEKMKKDPKELGKLKLKSLEEYSEKKTEFIRANKEIWVKEIVDVLVESEKVNDENEAIQAIKQSALNEYLGQERVIKTIVARAEQLESSYRKL